MKRNSYFGCVIALFFSVLLLLSISGCGYEIAPKPSLVIMAGHHSNSEKTSVSLDKAIKDTYSEFGSVAVIVVDGNPKAARDDEGNILGCLDDETISRLQKHSGNRDLWLNRYIAPEANQLADGIKLLGADDPEVDTLAAFFEAVKVLNEISPEDGGEKEIIIYDTGLCTSGALSFLEPDRQEYLFSDTPINLEKLRESLEAWGIGKEKLNLSGVKITWYGLGEVAAPQPILDERYKENLHVIWGEILQRANAISGTPQKSNSEYGFFVEVTSSGITSDLPWVSPVVRTTSTTVTEPEPHKSEIIPSNGITIPETTLNFLPNEAVFVDEEQAMAQLKKYAEEYLANSDERVLLVGTTADPNRNGGDFQLSAERARAVRDCFVKLKIDESRFDILGWGSRTPLYDPSEWNGNRFIESIAETNRTVRIYALDSDMAKILLGINE